MKASFAPQSRRFTDAIDLGHLGQSTRTFSNSHTHSKGLKVKLKPHLCSLPRPVHRCCHAFLPLGARRIRCLRRHICEPSSDVGFGFHGLRRRPLHKRSLPGLPSSQCSYLGRYLVPRPLQLFP